MLNYIGLKPFSRIKAFIACLIPMLNYIGLKQFFCCLHFSLFDTYVKLHRSKTNIANTRLPKFDTYVKWIVLCKGKTKN